MQTITVPTFDEHTEENTEMVLLADRVLGWQAYSYWKSRTWLFQSDPQWTAVWLQGGGYCVVRLPVADFEARFRSSTLKL